MKTIAQTLFYFCLMLTLLACGGGGGKDDPDPVIVPEPDPIPQAVNLIAPPNNSICVGKNKAIALPLILNGVRLITFRNMRLVFTMPLEQRSTP